MRQQTQSIAGFLEQYEGKTLHFLPPQKAYTQARIYLQPKRNSKCMNHLAQLNYYSLALTISEVALESESNEIKADSVEKQMNDSTMKPHASEKAPCLTMHHQVPIEPS